MNNFIHLSSVILSIALLSYASGVFSENNDLQNRLKKLENLLNNQVLLEQDKQIKQLKTEASSLRELLENQAHELNRVEKKQTGKAQVFDIAANKPPVKNIPPAPKTTRKAPWIKPPSVLTSKEIEEANIADEFKQAENAGDNPVFEKIFIQLKTGQYKLAIKNYTKFIEKNPDSKHIANAYYWLGEANYLLQNYQDALHVYNDTVEKYPSSIKSSEAELKIAYCYYELQNWPQARITFKRIIVRHPSTTLAAKAKIRLKQMKQDGH